MWIFFVLLGLVQFQFWIDFTFVIGVISSYPNKHESLYHWIGLREHVNPNSLFHGKKPLFPVQIVPSTNDYITSIFWGRHLFPAPGPSRITLGMQLDAIGPWRWGNLLPCSWNCELLGFGKQAVCYGKQS